MFDKGAEGAAATGGPPQRRKLSAAPPQRGAALSSTRILRVTRWGSGEPPAEVAVPVGAQHAEVTRIAAQAAGISAGRRVVLRDAASGDIVVTGANISAIPIAVEDAGDLPKREWDGAAIAAPAVGAAVGSCGCAALGHAVGGAIGAVVCAPVGAVGCGYAAGVWCLGARAGHAAQGENAAAEGAEEAAVAAGAPPPEGGGRPAARKTRGVPAAAVARTAWRGPQPAAAVRVLAPARREAGVTGRYLLLPPAQWHRGMPTWRADGGPTGGAARLYAGPENGLWIVTEDASCMAQSEGLFVSAQEHGNMLLPYEIGSWAAWDPDAGEWREDALIGVARADGGGDDYDPVAPGPMPPPPAHSALSSHNSAHHPGVPLRRQRGVPSAAANPLSSTAPPDPVPPPMVAGRPGPDARWAPAPHPAGGGLLAAPLPYGAAEAHWAADAPRAHPVGQQWAEQGPLGAPPHPAPAPPPPAAPPEGRWAAAPPPGEPAPAWAPASPGEAARGPPLSGSEARSAVSMATAASPSLLSASGSGVASSLASPLRAQRRLFDESEDGTLRRRCAEYARAHCQDDSSLSHREVRAMVDHVGADFGALDEDLLPEKVEELLEEVPEDDMHRIAFADAVAVCHRVLLYVAVHHRRAGRGRTSSVGAHSSAPRSALGRRRLP
eukprot:TRINITY_DN5288_c0_g3_i2.p1 TRINITY_DN5288_c0_g3~~TRINITY_DN5288_c0_g3_i2.p1  ORF type:complete len:694 (+),score=138.21 TRINITY_DN5288_c0_g3_i2:88-2082(+)